MQERDGLRANPGRCIHENVTRPSHPPTGNVQCRVNTTKLARGITRKLHKPQYLSMSENL